NEAAAYIESQVNEAKLFGGQKYESLDENARKEILAEVMPIIRGAVSDEKKMILTYDDGENIREFVNSHDAKELSQVGAACPDHLVHTKRVPLYIEWDPKSGDVESLKQAIKEGVQSFKEE